MSEIVLEYLALYLYAYLFLFFGLFALVSNKKLIAAVALILGLIVFLIKFLSSPSLSERKSVYRIFRSLETENVEYIIECERDFSAFANADTCNSFLPNEINSLLGSINYNDVMLFKDIESIYDQEKALSIVTKTDTISLIKIIDLDNTTEVVDLLLKKDNEKYIPIGRYKLNN